MAVRVSLIPSGNVNRPGIKLNGGKPDYITVHETANIAPGANAEMHRRFVHNGGGPEHVSFHFTVDDKEAIQLLPLDEVGWHAGDGGAGTGNRDSIAIEKCVNSDGDSTKTQENLATLIASLMKQFNIPIERVVQHNKWSGKDCPHFMRSRGGAGWNQLIDMVKAKAATSGVYVPETGHTIAVEVMPLWTKYGLSVLGYPLSEKYQEDGLWRQNFENTIPEWKDGENARFGAAIRRWKYPT